MLSLPVFAFYFGVVDRDSQNLTLGNIAFICSCFQTFQFSSHAKTTRLRGPALMLAILNAQNAKVYYAAETIIL